MFLRLGVVNKRRVFPPVHVDEFQLGCGQVHRRCHDDEARHGCIDQRLVERDLPEQQVVSAGGPARALNSKTRRRVAWGSRSTTSTRRPTAASAVARLIAVVVLPTPPFWLATAMIRPGRTGDASTASSAAFSNGGGGAVNVSAGVSGKSSAMSLDQLLLLGPGCVPGSCSCLSGRAPVRLRRPHLSSAGR